MHTPSLHRRVVALGVVVVVVVLAAVNVLLYLAFRAQLLDQLHETLEERARLIGAEAATRTPEELATRLAELGVRATVRAANGTTYEAMPPSTGVWDSSGPLVSGDVALSDGSTVTVFASRTRVDDTARNLLVFQGVGLVVAGLLGTLLLLRASRVALRPLREIAASARRTSAGQRGERLRPDRPHTRLGQLASAYDEMLDSLESAVGDATRAQLEAEQLYLHLRQTIETANGAFVAMDSSGRIIDWNVRAEAMFGWSRREAVGRDLAETLIPPALRNEHSDGLRRFLKTGEARILGRTLEMEAVHRDGHHIPVELATWITYQGEEIRFNAFVYDVTDRREGQEAASRLAAIVKSAQEAIFSTTLDGKVLTWNRGAERIYQFSPDEVIGKDVGLLVPADRRQELQWVRERVLQGEDVQRYETVRLRKDGSAVDVAVTVSPIFDDDGRVTALSTIARDITDQRRMEARLNATRSALEDALEDARQSEERSRRFLADAAHQLRSPITGVRAAAETLLLTAEGEDRDRLLALLVRETARAARLVKSLLRLAQVDEGYVLPNDRADLGALCQAELDSTRSQAPHLAVTLQVGKLPEQPPEVDSHAVREIISNLLDNARRHAATRIDLLMESDGDEVRVRVADDGPGVPADAIERIFERFVSVDGKGGSGLGLPIARALARAHGGDVTYRTSEGFLLTLPLKCDAASDTASSVPVGK